LHHQQIRLTNIYLPVFGQCKKEVTANPFFRFSPYLAAVLFNHFLANGKTYTGALKLTVSVEAIEYFKNLLGVLLVEPNAIVIEMEKPFNRAFGYLNLDNSPGINIVFNPVFNQVLEQFGKHGFVAGNSR
jgi:hypothetical protein